MKQSDTVKISLRLDKDTYNKLCVISKSNSSTISQVIRDYIDVGVGLRTTSDDIDKISEIIKKQVENVCEQPIERLIKIVIKNIKSTESSKYILCSLLKEFSNENVDEILENAETQAIIYATNRNS